MRIILLYIEQEIRRTRFLWNGNLESGIVVS